MRAVIITSFGGPEVLQVQERPAPVPARGEVRVRVMATAVNRADLLQRAGHYPAPRNVPADIPGLELAGTIDAVGEGVTEWQVGERVFGLVGGGAYAEHVVTHARTLARIPPHLSFTDAAAVPEAFITAYDAMVDQAHLAAGETVLITAVGSGVGTAAVQIARAIGARAIGTARTPDKLERAGRLGLTEGIDASAGSFAERVLELTEGEGAAVILELVGGAYLAEDVACAAERGRIVLVGMLGGSRAALEWGQVLQKRLTLTGTTLRSRPLEHKILVAQSFGRHVVPLLSRGLVSPVIDRVMPLSRADEAHAYVASNAGFGKVVLDCG
jgi:NADPH2:quinone reductase